MSQSPAITEEAVNGALDTIVGSVHKRAFLHRLAQHGRVIENDAEADAAVRLGFKLAAAQAHNQPQAPAFGKFAQALNALDNVLGQTEQTKEATCLQAAQAFAQDPAIYQAALLINQANATA